MSRGAVARALAWVMLLVMPATLAGSVAGSAYAQPGDPGDPGDQTSAAPGAVTLRWPSLGLQSTVDLYGDGSAISLCRCPWG